MKEKAQKRNEAEERHTEYRSLSIDERIKLVQEQPGESKRELNRLMNLKAKAEAKNVHKRRS